MSFKKEEFQDILNEIGKHAAKLHSLMKPGTTINITFIEDKNILIPNQSPKLSHLLIVKPEVYAEVKLTPKAIDGNSN
jgi:hypothetical protein